MSNHHPRTLNLAIFATPKCFLRGFPTASLAMFLGLTTLSLATTTQPAQAVNVTYNFTVQITSSAYEAQGLLNGTIEQGRFTYDSNGLKTYNGDSLPETRDEYVSASQGNLSLTFNFLNNLYTEKNDLNYGSQLYTPDYPAVLFTDGKLLGLDFLVVPSRFQPPQSAIGFRIFKDAFYFGSIDNSPEGSGMPIGTVTYGDAASFPEPPPSSAGGDVAAVPEPSEVGGAIVGSLLGLWAIKKAKSR